MSLDINGGAAQQRPDGEQDDDQPRRMTAGEEQQDGRDADMAAGESCRGTLAGGVGVINETMEEAVGVARQRHQIGVVAEIEAEMGEMALHNLIDAYGMEVILRSCHGQKDINTIVEEKSGDDGGGNTLEGGEVAAAPVLAQHDHGQEGDHGEIAPITHAERLGPSGAGHELTEQQRGLAAEKAQVELREMVVEVGEAAVELVGVGVPEDEPRQLRRGAEESGELKVESS